MSYSARQRLMLIAIMLAGAYVMWLRYEAWQRCDTCPVECRP
jgi:hypothetical protein